ncbi:phage holin family protein [Nocardioides sediminis]|uniref:phage holin family protein n=1 Tax=Nocardioides sediminis TaxID=433648 RepID=UPI000D314F24|nr:phage holin family protein [Nocardioides sediminis]
MIRFLVRTAIFLVSAAVGLLVTAWLVDGFDVSAGGFVTAVVLFAVIQSVLAPFIAKVTARNASALLGGVGLLSTFVALWLTALFGDALTIDGGATTWIAATVIVWLATALATLLLPLILVKAGIEAARNRT